MAAADLPENTGSFIAADGRFRAEIARALVLCSRHYGLLREAHSLAF